MIQASIDLGTNTCLLLVAECGKRVPLGSLPKSSRSGNSQKAMLRPAVDQVILDESTIVRLGEGVDQSKLLQKVPMERTLLCLKTYAEKLRQAGVSPDQAICVATSQARDAKNSQDFFATVEKQTGFRFKIISGEDEAKFTFLGALLPGMDLKSTSVIDIGGGSTEIMSIEEAQSVDIGSVRFTERFFKSDPVTDSEFWACQEAIDQALQKFLPSRKKRSAHSESLVAVAGTATTLAAWHLGLPKFNSSAVDAVVLTRGDVHRMVEELKWRTLEERQSLPAMDPLRADVLLAGALILWRVLEVLDFPACRVSSRGLRYGLLNPSLSLS